MRIQLKATFSQGKQWQPRILISLLWPLSQVRGQCKVNQLRVMYRSHNHDSFNPWSRPLSTENTNNRTDMCCCPRFSPVCQYLKTKQICDVEYRKGPYCQKLYFGWFFTSLLFIRNECRPWICSVRLKLCFCIRYCRSQWTQIDWCDFPTFEIEQNEPIDVRPSTSRALTWQELGIYFDQSAEDLAKYSKTEKFFSADANPCGKCVKVC